MNTKELKVDKFIRNSIQYKIIMPLIIFEIVSIITFFIYIYNTKMSNTELGDVLEVILPANTTNSISGSIALISFGFMFISSLGMILIVTLVCRRVIIRPIKSILEVNEQIRLGNIDARATMYSYDEIGIMVSELNSLLDSLGNSIETKEFEKNNMQNSIMKLLEDVSDAATGDLTVEANVGEDMTGAIADSFNHMIYRLRQLVLNVQKATVHVNTSVNEIQKNTEMLAQGSASQAEQILDSAAALDEMALSIQQVSENASLSSTVASQSLNSAKNGALAVQNTIQVISRMGNKVQETENHIKSLEQHSQDIGEIVSLISDISDRTSILAINASIEASLAGDAGHGFAIVAHEVERLAIRASEATKQIHNLVDTMQDKAIKAMIAMEESTFEVSRGSNVADEAGQALREIETVSSRLADLIQSISMSATQQARGSENLSQAMSEIANITKKTASETQQASHSINQLASLSNELREAVRIFKLPA